MEKFKYLQGVIIAVEKMLAKSGGEVTPCTQQEVDAIESMLSSPYRLPLADKEFLLYGGKKIEHWFGHIDSYYRSAKVLLEYNYQYILDLLQAESPQAEIPPELFVIEEDYLGHFTYLLLSEGENPPIYWWWKKDKGGLEISRKINESFTEHLLDKIVIATEGRKQLIRNKIMAGKPPRKKQFWLPDLREQSNGITRQNVMEYMGFDFNGISDVEQAATLVGLDVDSYLEELSGWKCREVIRNGSKRELFFPRSTPKNEPKYNFNPTIPSCLKEFFTLFE